MKLHTVFITYNRLECSKEAIASYLETVTVPYSLTVVDNGSSDGTVAWLKKFERFHECEVILLGENMYPGYACNRGWETAPADADFFQRADNDWRFLPGWCEQVASAFSFRRIGQVGLRTAKEECYPDGRTVTWNVGGNCVIRRRLWERGLRYDETPWPQMPQGLSEDTFFSPAVRRMGYRWVRVKKPCIVGISVESRDDPYYRKSWGDRGIYGFGNRSRRRNATRNPR